MESKKFVSDCTCKDNFIDYMKSSKDQKITKDDDCPIRLNELCEYCAEYLKNNIDGFI